MDPFLFQRIYESHVPSDTLIIPMDDLDPTVFRTFDDGRMPILMTGIRAQILKDIDSINSLVAISDFFMTGDLLTKKYNPQSEILVITQIEPTDLTNISHSSVVRLLNKLNSRYATGTTHPIKYTIVVNDFNEDKIDNIYDIINERWVKTGPAIDKQLAPVYNKFISSISSIDIATGELKQKLINIKDIENLTPELKQKFHSLLNKRVKSLESNIKQLLSKYKNMEYKDDMSPKDIIQYKSKSDIPEDVIHKLLEKYYYVKFLKNLSNLIGDNSGNKNYTDIIQKMLNVLTKMRKV